MRRSKGFTLIELLVAIAVMALLAIMSWRGLDGMARAEAQNRERGDAILTLQTALSQWGADLDATVALSRIRAIDWDGRVLRLTRRSTDGDTPRVYVVAWALRTDPATGTRWRRWQSPGFTTQADWQQAWERAAAWAQGSSNDAGDAEVDLLPMQEWQIYYFRNDAWGPAVSADALGTSTPLPDGVRLVINIPPGAALSGTITRDWVRPSVTVPKS
ncbi:type II secretion system protein J [Variovorax sp. Sphag1AA]|uniref:PulJ/GspJ family protein n=1 Tax=Variovorax sp. Sphag1AA TaxID=2587027 RepID=UPI00162142D3|nr:prepilin-type N-terminal cleavage/methylation domain-containing protein [Variovorax sp. Sphag1AA]MBB3177253.1 general secretion pathway protein J [Variovorax sp. Sphag1AA]